MRLEKISETKAAGKPDAERYLHGPMTWKVMQRKCVERDCELANKQLSKLITQSRDAMHG